ncbi:MAG: CcoQ/FixQ family Cbb3-type cytochrome c oxidase assembly chaperone [Deltaproteobacteria bacterium]|nr:CcoQ/FixQ family Cbb3-type cytochrome c oxidase assembly chaperone [Deltaproteobacteria bacterium]
MLPLATAFFFLAFFVCVLLWVANGKRKPAWDEAAALPLFDDSPRPRQEERP